MQLRHLSHGPDPSFGSARYQNELCGLKDPSCIKRFHLQFRQTISLGRNLYSTKASTLAYTADLDRRSMSKINKTIETFDFIERYHWWTISFISWVCIHFSQAHRCVHKKWFRRMFHRIGIDGRQAQVTLTDLGHLYWLSLNPRIDASFHN